MCAFSSNDGKDFFRGVMMEKEELDERMRARFIEYFEEYYGCVNDANKETEDALFDAYLSGLIVGIELTEEIFTEE